MNVIEIFAKFVMDTSSLDDGLKDAEKKTSSFGSKIGSGLAGAAKLGAAALATTATAAVGAATAIGAVAKQSADAYAQYQQLEGGVETLFNDGGKAAANYRAELEAAGATEAEIARAMANFKDPIAQVLENAAKAYQTAGMSANQYMDTVINMAASLNKATGDAEESTRLADMAIIDMADNVNKMGTSMEMVQNAYRGFTRGNFTMLDNLALGYAGTKEGMQELLADAEKISGIKYDISSYADIVQAIHTIQEEMGITNTTQEEAAKTISGSAGALAAAWDNLILGLADSNADLGELVDNVVQSAKTAFTNIIPAFTQAVRGIGDLVGQIAPVIAEELPGVVDQVLPPLLDAASSLISSVIEAIPGLLGVLEQNSDMLMSSFMGIIDTVLSGLYEFVVKDLDSLLTTLVDNVITPLLAETPHLLATLINIAGQVLSSLASQLPALITTLVQTIVDLFGVLVDADNITYYIGIAEEVIGALMTGLLQAFPILLDALPDLITGLLTGLLDGLEMIADDLMTVATPILEELVPAVYEALGRIFPELAEKVLPLLDNFVKNTVPRLVQTWTQIFSTEFPKILNTMLPIIIDLIMGIVQTLTMIVQYLPMIIEAILPLIPVIMQAIVEVLPETLPILLNSITQLIIMIAENLPALIEPLLVIIPTLLITLIDVLLQCSPMIFDAVTSILAIIIINIFNFWASILSAMPTFFTNLLTALGKLFVDYINLIGEFFVSVGTFLKEGMGKVWSIIYDTWSKIYDGYMTWLAGVILDVADFFVNLWDDITGFYDDLMLEFAGWVIGIGDKFTEIVDKITEIITGLIDDALTWGKDLIDNFVQGISDNDDLENAIGENGITGTVRKFMHFSEPDEGPLSDFSTYAPDMMKTFAQGIRDNTSVVTGAVSDAFNFGGMITGQQTGGGVLPGLIAPTTTQPITIVLELDKQQFGKIVYNMNQAETQRVGVTLGKEAFA